MKIIFVIIFTAIVCLCLVSIESIYGLPFISQQYSYDTAKHVIVGRIISVEFLKDPNSQYFDPKYREMAGLALYEIQVDEYMKNPMENPTIQVLGRYINQKQTLYYERFPYEINQRVLLYLVTSDIPQYDLMIDPRNSRVISEDFSAKPTLEGLKNKSAPLQQIKFGLSINEIVCKNNLVLLQKYDGSPACVKPSTKQKLIERGWTKSLPPCTSDRTACFNQESNMCDPSGWDCGDDKVFSEIISMPEKNHMTSKQIAIKEIQDKIMSVSSHDKWRQQIQKQVDERNLEPFSAVFVQDMKGKFDENENISFTIVNFGYRNWCLMPSISVYHEDYDLPIYEGAIVHTCPAPLDNPVPRISIFNEEHFRDFPTCQFEGTYTIWAESFEFGPQVVGSFYCNSGEKFAPPKTVEITIPEGSSDPDIQNNFTPSEINLNYGDYLRVINQDKEVHEVILFVDKQSGSAVFGLRVNPNESFTEPIRNFGTFELISWDEDAHEYPWMHGTVTVRED